MVSLDFDVKMSATVVVCVGGVLESGKKEDEDSGESEYILLSRDRKHPS